MMFDLSCFRSITCLIRHRLPNGEPESEAIPRDVQEKLDMIKENFHVLEIKIREQRLYLSSLSRQQVSTV